MCAERWHEGQLGANYEVLGANIDRYKHSGGHIQAYI